MLRFGRSALTPMVLLAIAVIVLFTKTLDYGFLYYDDVEYIQADPVVSKGLSIKGLKYAFSQISEPYFMPATRLSYMLDVSLFGNQEAFGFRLTNLLLHLAVSIGVYFLFLSITGKSIESIIISLLFAVHPQHVEAVVWVAGRKELVAGLFGILSLLAYTRYVRVRRRRWYFVSLLGFGASLFGKPIWVVLPLLMLLWDVLLDDRIKRTGIPALVLEKAPFFFIAVAYSIIFVLSTRVGHSSAYLPDLDWSNRPLYLWTALMTYFENTLTPTSLSALYTFQNEFDYPKLAGYSFLFLTLFAIGYHHRKSHKGILFALTWFLVALAAPLKISIFPQGENILMADRYAYLSHIGFIGGMVLFAAHWVRTGLIQKHLPVLVVTLFGIYLSAVSYTVTNQWRSPEVLWKHALKEAEGQGRSYIHGLLGSYYQRMGRREEALASYMNAHTIYPGEFVYPYLIAGIYDQDGSQQELAEQWVAKVLEEYDLPVEFLVTIGLRDYERRNTQRAESILGEALEKMKRSELGMDASQVYLFLGLSQLQNGNYEAAFENLGVIRIAPDLRGEFCTAMSSMLKGIDEKIVNRHQAQIDSQCEGLASSLRG